MYAASCHCCGRMREMVSIPSRWVLIPLFVVTALLLYVVNIQTWSGPRLLARTKSINSSAGEHDNHAICITNSTSVVLHQSTMTTTCESIYDLSNGVDTSTMPNALDSMRACGWSPRLLSRAVSRSGDSDSSHVVPNVVHYILYSVPKGVTFEFQHYLAFRSASQFLKPDYIFLHGDIVPEGEWWARTVAEVDNLYHVYREKPAKIHGRKVVFVQHLADFTRLTVLIGEQVFTLIL